MNQPPQPRRAFLCDCVRYPVLAVLAVLGVVLAWRKGDPSAVEQCLKQRVCRGCSLFTDCDKPQAVETRQHS